MKIKLVLVLSFFYQASFSQPCENIIIITTDGYRWQELFNGADSAILFNIAYVKDTNTARYTYWANDPAERRRKLMPFTWNFISQKGQLWGNRQFDNKITLANPYRISYAGYNEILTGYADRAIMTNKPKWNRNNNVLEYLQSLPAYHDKIAVFGSWKLFSYILNDANSRLPVNCGYMPAGRDSLTVIEQAVNLIQENSIDNKLPTRSDILTFSLAAEYMRIKHPRIIYIGFGETDEFAHHGRYDKYLDQANMFDKMLAEIWSMVQSDEFYKNKTTLFITTDHGRGRKPGKWTTHGPLTGGSDESWLIQLGPNILPLGEVKLHAEFTSEQFAETIARYMGTSFIADHPVAEAMPVIKQ